MTERFYNIEIFQNTMQMCNENKSLKNAVSNSIRKENIICGTEALSGIPMEKKTGRIAVTPNSSFHEASMHAGKVCVLNFANAFHPGGGVENGASAQEESLCRVSTLYPCITSDQCMNHFYLKHKNNCTFLGYDDCIYTPDIIVFKSDNGKLLEEKDWYTCDVITCAAPDLHAHPDFSDQKLYELMRKRTDLILKKAVHEQVDTLVLGAFGCGAFHCNPVVVSKAMMHECLKYRFCFDEIVFAIYASHAYDHNLEVFTETYHQMVMRGNS